MRQGLGTLCFFFKFACSVREKSDLVSRETYFFSLSHLMVLQERSKSQNKISNTLVGGFSGSDGG